MSILVWIITSSFIIPSSAESTPVKSASELDYPPFSSVLDDGRAGGFSVELMREALHAMGRKVTFEVRPWSEIKLDLEKGRLEALPLVGRTPEREEVFDFTIPYISLYGAVFVRDDEDNIKILEDLRDRRVGVLHGDNAEEFMRREKITNQLVTAPAYSDLELEVLETSALDDMLQVSQLMQSCSKIGVSFALDDFGTGYSSLTYLKNLPATQLKIDQSFVRDMLDDPEDLAILEGILGLARAFRRQAIAEGVETLAHGEMLLQLDCELAQGYSIAKPMPANELIDWSKTWQPDPTWTHQQPMHRNDLPLLFAGIEHRSWIHAIEECLKGERSTPPQLDHHQCRFGHWLEGEGQVRYGAHPAFQAIAPLHKEAHTLATDLLELHALNSQPVALESLHELNCIRDKLLIQLKHLVQQ
ncbi:MAG: EAL domain-containing protein [Candidatus Thiodiazotropha sp. (ex. Lucinoma kazani)]